MEAHQQTGGQPFHPISTSSLAAQLLSIKQGSHGPPPPVVFSTVYTTLPRVPGSMDTSTHFHQGFVRPLQGLPYMAAGHISDTMMGPDPHSNVALRRMRDRPAMLAPGSHRV